MKINFILILFILAIIFMYSINVEEDESKSKNMELILNIILIFIIFNVIYDYMYLNEKFAQAIELNHPNGANYYHNIDDVTEVTSDTSWEKVAKNNFKSKMFNSDTNNKSYKLKVELMENDVPKEYYLKSIVKNSCDNFQNMNNHVCDNNLILEEITYDVNNNILQSYLDAFKFKKENGDMCTIDDFNDDNITCTKTEDRHNLNSYSYHITTNNNKNFNFKSTKSDYEYPYTTSITPYSSFLNISSWIEQSQFSFPDPLTFTSGCGDVSLNSRIYIKFVKGAENGIVDSNPFFNIVLRYTDPNTSKERDFILGYSDDTSDNYEDPDNSSQKLFCKKGDNYHKLTLWKEITSPNGDNQTELGKTITPLNFQLIDN